MNWQPIETAEKVEGRHVLLAYADGTVLEGVYLDNSKTSKPWQGWRPNSGRLWPVAQPTHWMPLPEPPVLAAQAGKGKA